MATGKTDREAIRARQPLAMVAVTRTLWKHRRVLAATVRVELRKRYTGSLLGRAWVVLYPLLFLSVYLLLYLVIFKIRLPEISTLEYVLYIFSGLVPYTTFMEATNGAVVSIKQNVHLIRNVILPVELIPARTVGIALVTQSVGVIMVLGLGAAAGSLTWRSLLLVVALLIQLVFLLGVALLVAPLGIMFPDVAYFMSIFLLFALFVSPIAFQPDALPAGTEFLVWANPIHYLLIPFRLSVLPSVPFVWTDIAVSGAIALLTFVAGSAFFTRSKSFFLDYE